MGKWVMKELAVSKLSRDRLLEHVDEMLKTMPVIRVTLEDAADKPIGNWTMSRLWRSWMKSTADFAAAKGTKIVRRTADGREGRPRPYDENDAHYDFTVAYIGTNDDGEPLSWARSGKNIASKDQRIIAMTKHKVFMMEQGIKHIDPADSEFRSLCEHMGI